jgi:hypothetical protein
MFLAKQDWSGTCFPAAVATGLPRRSGKAPSGTNGPDRGLLSALEHDVVALSLFDPLSSIDPPSAVHSALIRLFGTYPPNHLADPRLEALRRYCILRRETKGALPAAENDRILSAGFSETALMQADALVVSGRYP